MDAQRSFNSVVSIAMTILSTPPPMERKVVARSADVGVPLAARRYGGGRAGRCQGGDE